MKKLMAIFAHPDDESAVSGTLAHYAQNGTEVALVCATRGEAGEISDPSLATPENLGQVRQAELEDACRVLGIKHLEFLNFCDSGMQDSPVNENPLSLIQADDQQVIRKIVASVRRFRPEIVITFEPFGWYGHPDHMAVSRLTTEAMTVVGNEEAYTDLGPAWQPRKFFYAVIAASHFKEMVQYAIDAGQVEEGDFESNLAQNRPEVEAEELVTHAIDVSPYYDLKRQAMIVHKTQYSEDHMFLSLPRDVLERSFGYEYFIQVYPQPEQDLLSHPAADLFNGLNG